MPAAPESAPERMPRPSLPASRRQSACPAAGGGLITHEQLVAWINERLGSTYKDFEDIAPGVAYCELLDQLRPGSVPLKKVRRDAQLEHERLRNYKLLEQGMDRAGLRKPVAIEGLIAGRFREHYELAKWMKKLFDQELEAPDGAPEAGAANKHARQGEGTAGNASCGPRRSRRLTGMAPPPTGLAEQARTGRHPGRDPRTGPGFNEAREKAVVERGATDCSGTHHAVLLSIGTLCRLHKAENGEGAALADKILELLDGIQLDGRAGGDGLTEN